MNQSFYARAVFRNDDERLVAVTYTGEEYFRVVNVDPAGNPVSEPYPIPRGDLLSLKELVMKDRESGPVPVANSSEPVAPESQVAVGVDASPQQRVVGRDSDGNPLMLTSMPRPIGD